MSIILSLSHFPDFIPSKTNIIKAQLIIESQLHKRRKIKDCFFLHYLRNIFNVFGNDDNAESLGFVPPPPPLPSLRPRTIRPLLVT